MTLRIVHIHDKPPGSGGLRRHVEEVVALSSEFGWHASALQIARDGARADDTTPESDGTGTAKPAALPRSYGPFHPRGIVRRVVDAIAAQPADIVHLHAGFTAMSRTVLLAIAARWPTVATLHDVAPFCLNGQRLVAADGTPCQSRCGLACLTSRCSGDGSLTGLCVGIGHHAIKTGLRTAWLGLDELIVPSAYMRSLALAHGARPQALSLVPHAIRAADPAPVPSGRPLILFVGNLTREKGADLMIEALIGIAGLPWSACLIGDGPLRGELERQVARHGLGDRIEFAGRLGADDIARWRQRSSFAVMPSRVMESFGLAGLESLAAGRAVVASARGGATQWLRHSRNGLGFDPDKPHALAETLALLTLDSGLAARMGEEARRLVAEEFAPSLFGERLGAIYMRAKASFHSIRRTA